MINLEHGRDATISCYLLVQDPRPELIAQLGSHLHYNPSFFESFLSPHPFHSTARLPSDVSLVSFLCLPYETPMQEQIRIGKTRKLFEKV